MNYHFYSKKRFIDLTCCTQLFRVACRILKLLLKLPYSGSIKKIALCNLVNSVACISQLQSLSWKFEQASLKTGAR